MEVKQIEDKELLQQIKEESRLNVDGFVKDCLVKYRCEGPYVDVACGYKTKDPYVRAYSQDKSVIYVALDSASSFSQAPHEGSKPNVRADATAIPLGDQSAGTVICIGSIEHIEDDNRAVNEMARVLEDGGRLIITYPGKDMPLHEKLYQRDFRRYADEDITEQLNQDYEEIEIKKKIVDGKEIDILVTGKRKTRTAIS